MRRVVLLLMVLAVSGCYNKRDIQELDAGGMAALSADSTKRTIIFNGKGMFCAEPSPDSGEKYAKSLAAGGKVNILEKGGGEASYNDTDTSDVVQLYQRSQGIQGLRDGMYRVCEAYVNGAIPADVYARQMNNLILTMNYLVSMEVCADLAKTVKSTRQEASQTAQVQSDTSVYHYQQCLYEARNMSGILLNGKPFEHTKPDPEHSNSSW